MKPILLFDRVKNKVRRMYRERVLFARTGQHAKLMGHVTILNENLHFGRNVTLFPDVMIFGDGEVTVGDNVAIGNGTVIYASKAGGGVTIGSDTAIAAQCYIIDTDHGIAPNELIRNQSNTVAPVLIGSDVWIAANCSVLKGSVIENGAIIGAKSLVKSRIAQNSICVGVPARLLKYR